MNIQQRNKVAVKYVRFDAETDRKLTELAEKDDRTIASIIRTAVIQYIKRRAA